MTPGFRTTARVIENVRLARDTYRVRFRCPEIAAHIRPGQFVMVRQPGVTDPLLGRPFALYDLGGDTIDVVYLVVGKVTRLMAQANPGDEMELWGPLGRGFLPLPECEHVTLVAGGIGQTPFFAYAKELLSNRRVSLFYGVRSAEYAACVDEFRQLGIDVLLATDDGTAGHHGFVTELLREERPSGPIVTCGPMPMMRAVAAIASERGEACHASLETPMACGFGACFSCVTPVKTEAGGWDYRRVCVDGPVFDAGELVWSEGIERNPFSSRRDREISPPLDPLRGSPGLRRPPVS